MTAPVLLAYIPGALLIQLAAGIGVAVWPARGTGGRHRTAVEAIWSSAAVAAWPGWRAFRQNCLACHSEHKGARPDQSNRPAFSHALLPVATRENCASCHTAPKTTIHRDVTGGCTKCHSSERWKPATFDHAKFFVLDRNHNAECTTCHVNNDTSKYTCYGCHEHQPDRIRSKHVREGIPNFENCVKCHRSGHGDNEGGGEGGREGRERD